MTYPELKVDGNTIRWRDQEFQLDAERRERILGKLKSLPRTATFFSWDLPNIPTGQYANVLTLAMSVNQQMSVKTLFDKINKAPEDVWNPRLVVHHYKPEVCIPDYNCKKCAAECVFHVFRKKFKQVHWVDGMAVRWLHNSVMLSKYGYDARKVNPLKIQEDTYHRYHWYGLQGDKLRSLWIRIMNAQGIWCMPLNEVEMPIDIQVGTLAFKTGMLTLIKPDNAYIGIDSHKQLLQYVYRLGTPLDYDEGAWNVSRGCTKCNTACPIFELCARHRVIPRSFGTFQVWAKDQCTIEDFIIVKPKVDLQRGLDEYAA